MSYVDGYVLPVPNKNLQAYRRMARREKSGRSTAPLESGDDLRVKMGVPSHV